MIHCSFFDPLKKAIFHGWNIEEYLLNAYVCNNVSLFFTNLCNNVSPLTNLSNKASFFFTTLLFLNKVFESRRFRFFPDFADESDDEYYSNDYVDDSSSNYSDSDDVDDDYEDDDDEDEDDDEDDDGGGGGDEDEEGGVTFDFIDEDDACEEDDSELFDSVDTDEYGDSIDDFGSEE